MSELKNFIELTVVTTVRVPLTDSITKSEMETIINDDLLFEDERIDWNHEDRISEDYSYSAHNFKLVNSAGTFEHNSEYTIGTIYESVELTKTN